VSKGQWGTAEVAGPVPRKYNFFTWILPQILTGRKHGQSLEALRHHILQFSRERKLTKTAKIIQKITVRPGGAVALSVAHSLNTPLVPELSSGNFTTMGSRGDGGSLDHGTTHVPTLPDPALLYSTSARRRRTVQSDITSCHAQSTKSKLA